MKVLFYVPSKTFGGGESYIFNFIKESIDYKNYDFKVLTACPELFELLSELNCDVKMLRTSPSFGIEMFLGLMKINLEISRVKPDIVFLNGLPESGAMSRYIYAPTADKITICHSNEYWLKERPLSNIKRLIRSVISWGFFKYVDKIIVITEEAKKSVEYRNLFDCRLKKIYNGIPQIDLKREREREKGIVFGRISRLCPGKGNEMLLRAVSSLKKNGFNFKLVIAGEGEQLHLLKTMTYELNVENEVHFIGHVSPSIFFSKIDCMVSPSDMEALPTVISEAMSCFVPIIATSVGGVPEMLEHMTSGYLMPPNDEEKLTEYMRLYLTNPDYFDTLAVKAFDVYQQKFSIKSSTKKTWDFIHEQY